MSEADRNVTFTAGITDEQRSALAEFQSQADEHVSALQALARQRLTRSADEGEPVPEEIRITVTVGPKPEPAEDSYGTDPGTDDTTIVCSDIWEPCGSSIKGGKIYCHVMYCIILPPVTIVTE
jgi:hypothetical protein